jgi:hypothetical protein
MYPLRIVETEREGFEQTVVELWRANDFVGMVFWDGSATVIQIYPADDDVHDLEATDLIRVIETAQRIVDPFAFDEVESAIRLGAAGDEWGDEDPLITTLVTEFDPLAAHRSDSGEGFFPGEAAAALVDRCQELGLAVVEMEGFDLKKGKLKGRPGLTLMIPPPAEELSFPDFADGANAAAVDALSKWPQRESMVIAFVVQQADGETIVL